MKSQGIFYFGGNTTDICLSLVGAANTKWCANVDCATAVHAHVDQFTLMEGVYLSTSRNYFCYVDPMVPG